MDLSRRNQEVIALHVFFYKRGEYFNTECIADLLQRTLTGDYAQVWDMLLTMTAISKSGMQMFHIQGLVGSGKTTGIRGFCVLFSLRFDGNILICTSQNAPCDKFTEDMYEASPHNNAVSM